MGTAKGWTLFFGGHSGFTVHQGEQVATGLTSDEVKARVRALLAYYKGHAQPKERTSRFLDRVGTDWLEAAKGEQVPSCAGMPRV